MLRSLCRGTDVSEARHWRSHALLLCDQCLVSRAMSLRKCEIRYRKLHNNDEGAGWREAVVRNNGLLCIVCSLWLGW